MFHVWACQGADEYFSLLLNHQMSRGCSLQYLKGRLSDFDF
jgi:hypothetical protein